VSDNTNFDPQRTLELLLSAIPDDADQFRRLSASVENWDQVFNCAVLNSVESLLHYYLREVGFDLPRAVQERVCRWQMIKDLWQSHAQSSLEDVLEIFNSASIRAVALKGPLLGERLYPDPRMRLSADLDLLVAANDLDRAVAALKDIGYGTGKESEARFLRKYHYHIVLSRSSPPAIELHFRLADSFGVRIPAEDFLSRAGVYRTRRGNISSILSPEDEMLYLCVHAAGHRFIRLSWLFDIKLLLLQHPDLDWKTLLSRADALHIRNAVLFTCETLRVRFGLRPPLCNEIRQPLRSRVANVLLAATARQPDPSRRSLIGKMAFVAVLCDRPSRAAAFLTQQLMLVARRRARRHFPSFVPEEWSY
jgi:hypothetical protein